jgi:hypothetical protein
MYEKDKIKFVPADEYYPFVVLFFLVSKFKMYFATKF